MMIAIDKSYIEDEINDLNQQIKDLDPTNFRRQMTLSAKIIAIGKLVSQGIEIPIEESWKDDIYFKFQEVFEKYDGFNEFMEEYYPNGVIIKPK